MYIALIIITIIAVGVAVWSWTKMRRQAKQEDDKKTLKQLVAKWEDHIIVLSGPSLAASGIIAGLDVLTGSLIKIYFPVVSDGMGMIWAICLMLTLDFQVLTLGVRARRIQQSSKDAKTKFGQMVLCLLIASFLAYVSMQMASIFSKMVSDQSMTLDAAQAALGINANWLIYERSALVMVLIFMSGFLREVDEQESAARGQQNTALENLLATIAAMAQQSKEASEQFTKTLQQMVQRQQDIAAQQIEQIQQIVGDTRQSTEQIAQESANQAEQFITSAKQLATGTQSAVEALQGQIVESLSTGMAEIKDALLTPREKLRVLRTEQGQQAAKSKDIDTRPMELSDDLLDLLSSQDELADIDRSDISKVLQAFHSGVGKSEIYKHLGWGSAKHTRIVKPVIDTFLAISKEQQVAN